MAFIRLPLVLVAHGFAFAYFQSQGAVQPWATAQAWTNVYFTFLVDVPCLALLAWVVHREGQTLRNVIGFERRRLPRDVALGLGLALVLVVPFLAITFASNALLVGSQQVGLGALPPLPTWARWWSALILPISAALVEEVAYRGYALPRLANVFGNSWLALLLVSLGYGLQHIALPLTDPQVSVARFSATFLQGGVYALLYLRLRRLIPLIVAHWVHNFVGLLGLALADSPQ
jgi:membrane protease YdiL (CAAX protease family)